LGSLRKLTKRASDDEQDQNNQKNIQCPTLRDSAATSSKPEITAFPSLDIIMSDDAAIGRSLRLPLISVRTILCYKEEPVELRLVDKDACHFSGELT